MPREYEPGMVQADLRAEHEREAAEAAAAKDKDKPADDKSKPASK